MSFDLTERFNQDALEEYFGGHGNIGRKNDNSDLYNFGYNSNTICMQRWIAPVAGNTRGGHKQKHRVSCVSVDNAPLPKRHQANDLLMIQMYWTQKLVKNNLDLLCVRQSKMIKP